MIHFPWIFSRNHKIDIAQLKELELRLDDVTMIDTNIEPLDQTSTKVGLTINLLCLAAYQVVTYIISS